jgi:hypothetical protein
MKPTEELYNLANDPFEMTNLANDSKSKKALKTMLKRYDAGLLHWKQEVVDYNNYKQYVSLFDRTIQYEQKTFKKK